MSFYSFNCKVINSIPNVFDTSSDNINVSFMLPSEYSLTLDNINKAFPFEGLFKYRIEVRSDMLSGLRNVNTHQNEYYWLDLVDNNEIITFYKPDQEINLQAILIDPKTDEEFSNDEYIDKIYMSLPNINDRPERYPVITRHNQNTISQSGIIDIRISLFYRIYSVCFVCRYIA